MIKIDITQLKKWDEIKKSHQRWYKEEILYDITYKYNCLKKISRSSKMIKEYTDSLKKIIDIGPSYVIEEDLLKNLKGKEHVSLTLMLKKNKEKSPLENIINQEMKKKIKQEDLSEIIISIRSKKLKQKKAKKNLLKVLKRKKYNNINFNLLSKIINEFPTANRGNIVDIKKANKAIFSTKDFLPNRMFDYEKFSNKKNEKKIGWGRHKLISMMGIRVCSYCQRNYITNYHDEGWRKTKTVDDEGMEKTTADLDHFYSQSEFPYLALSLYNFIPSCPICNSRFKRDISTYNKKVLNPYSESFDDVKFKTKFTSSLKLINNLIDGKEDGFEVSLNTECSVRPENKERVIETINMFGLNEVYKTSHNKYIQDMLENTIRHPESEAEDIASILYLGIDNSETKKEQDINVLKKRIEQITIKPYEYKIKEGEPLGKLTKDILEEFGIKL